MESTVSENPVCRSCGKPFDHRVRRGKVARTFFGWLPLRRYVCYYCNKKGYRIAI